MITGRPKKVVEEVVTPPTEAVETVSEDTKPKKKRTKKDAQSLIKSNYSTKGVLPKVRPYQSSQIKPWEV